MSHHTETEEEYFDQPCTACDRPLREGGEHINWVMLNKKAEWDSPIGGNVLYDVPGEYAMTLICDECMEEDNDPEYALRGEDLERVPIDELEDLPPMRDRAAENLDEEFVDEVREMISELSKHLSQDQVDRHELVRYVVVAVGTSPDDASLGIHALVQEGFIEEEEHDEGATISLVDE